MTVARAAHTRARAAFKRGMHPRHRQARVDPLDMPQSADLAVDHLRRLLDADDLQRPVAGACPQSEILIALAVEGLDLAGQSEMSLRQRLRFAGGEGRDNR